jgi:signal transduction histidine kinase
MFTDATDREASATEPARAGQQWRFWIPLAAVVFALIALVVIPILRMRLVDPLSEDLQSVVEPGRSLVTRIHVALAEEGSLVPRMLEQRDTALTARYRGAVADEQAAYAELEPLIAQLGPAAKREFRELTALQSQWHSAIDRSLAAAPGTSPVRDPFRSAVFEELLVTVSRLDEALNVGAQRRWAEIAAMNRAQGWVTVLVGVLALGAALIVGWLASRLRVFAVAADRRSSELEQAIEARARIMRGVSHDLKNPLNAILGHTELLEHGIKGPLTDEQKATLIRIRKSVDALLSLIDDILDLSRAEGGRLRITPGKTQLLPIIRESIAEHSASADAVGNRLIVELPSDLPPITTDPQRVQQILGNLLSNAIKYTPQGGQISVRAEMRSRNDANGGQRWAAIDVIDTGPGIPSDQRERVFDEFSRLKIHDDKPGAGLGLAIARRVSRLLGGDLTVTSADSRGSVFTLWLPLETDASNNKEKNPKHPSAPGASV